MTTLILTAVFPWLLIGLGTWLGYQLVRQNGRILLRLEAIERKLSPQHAAQRRESGGLPIGTPAPDFELPDLAGVRRNLSEFRGKDLLLIFFSPKCGFCTKMAADLAALAADGGNGRAVPIVVSNGDVDENRKLVEQFGIRCMVLMQKEMELASKYRAQGTPMGYRIDREGRMASELTVGADSLLKLADLKYAPPPVAKGSKHGTNHKSKQPDPSLARSKLNRSGLKAGTVAPDFSLPRIGGGDIALADLRGNRVLLVFSDPNCGPCDELAPRLQELHEEESDLQMLVISRRDAEATAAKAAALELTYPIAMQQQWEISKQYGMFATPIGYLIDEEGIIVHDVAVGVQPILALADRPVPLYVEAEPSLNGKEAALTT